MSRPKTDGLTQREKEVYDYIKNFKMINGYSPSIYEIAQNLYTSYSYVSCCINSLQEKGYIKFNPKQRRTITITKII